MAGKDIYHKCYDINFVCSNNRLDMYIYDVDEDEQIRIEENLYYDALMSELWQKESMERESRKSYMEREW